MLVALPELYCLIFTTKLWELTIISFASDEPEAYLKISNQNQTASTLKKLRFEPPNAQLQSFTI